MKQIFPLLLFILLSNVLSGQNPVDLKYRIQCIEGDTIEDASCDVCPPEQGKPFWGARIEDPFGRSKYIQQPYTPVQRGNYVIVTYSVDSSTFIPVDFAELTTAQAIIDTLNKCPFPPSDSVGLITRFEMTQDSNVVISIRQPDGKDKADTADLRPAFDDTDQQLLDLSGDLLSIDRGNSIDLSPYLDNTDDQILDTLTFDSGSSILTASIEGDGVPALEVDLSSLLDNTDNQNLTGATLTGTTLQIQIEDGTSASVDLSSLQDGTGTDDQQVDTFVLNGNEILLSIEGDGVPALSIELSQYMSTDDQNLTGATLTGTSLEIQIEDGNSVTVDLASLQDGTGTDDQQLTLSGNSLSLEDGGAAIDLSPYLDDTDDQTIDTFSLFGNLLTVSLLDDGVPALTVDLSPYLDNTDNQNLTGATLTGTSLQIDIEDGTSATVDLSSLQDGTGTDDQQISLVGNSLNLEDGGAVIDLSPYLDNTDDQTIDQFSIAGDVLSLSLENDGQPPSTVNLSPYLDNTDSQTLSLTGLDLSISNGNTVTLPEGNVVAAENGVNSSTVGNTATVKLGGTLTENTSIPTTTSYNLDISTAFVEGAIGTRWNTTREGLDGFRAGAASAGAFSLWGWDSSTGAAESLTRVENSSGTEKSQLRLTETFGRFSFDSENFVSVSNNLVSIWAKANGTDASSVDIDADDNVTVSAGGQADIIAGEQSKMSAPSIRFEVPAGSGGAGTVFDTDLLQYSQNIPFHSNPEQIALLRNNTPSDGFMSAGRQWWGAMPLIEIQTEEGGPTTLLNPLDTFLLRLFTANPGGGQGGLWTLGGSNEALYQAGDVQVDKDLRVKGKGSEYREQSTTVVKKKPTEVGIETLTWRNSPSGQYGDLNYQYIGQFEGDTATADFKGWIDVEVDTVRFYANFDTLEFNMANDVDSDVYLSAYLGSGAYGGNVAMIWFDALYQVTPFGVPNYKYPVDWLPLDTVYLDSNLTQPIPFYDRMPIDSTTDGATVVVKEQDTTTYSPGYHRYATLAEVDSMIAEATQGGLDELSIDDLFINEPFGGFSFFDDLDAGALSRWGNLSTTAMLNFEAFAFGSKAWLTVRGTATRPVTFRGLDENLNQMAEIRSEPDGGVLELFNTAGSGLIKLDAGGRSIIGPATFRNDQYGILVDNITTTETARLTGIEIGTPGFAGGDIVSYDVTAWINEFGEAHFSKVTASDFVSTMKPDSSYQMEVLGESSVRMARFLQDSTDNSTLSLFNGAGTETVSLRAGSQSRFSEGVALGEYNNSPYTGVLAHIKEDDRVGAPQWSYPDNFALVIEDQSDDAEISLYSPNGSSILFSDDADQYAGRIRWDNSANQLSLDVASATKLSVTNSGVDVSDGDITILNTGSHSDPLFRMYSDSGSSGDYFDIQDVDNQQVLIEKRSALSQALIDISPIPVDRSSNAQIRLFQNTNTTGKVSLSILNGDGSSDVNTELKGVTAGSGDSYINAFGGNLGIGTTTPIAKLHLNDGDLLVSRFGAGNRATIALSHADATGDVNIQQDAAGNAIFENLAGSNLHYVGTGIHQFNVGGSEVARIASGGLGIGTTSIAADLHVGGFGDARFGTGTDYFEINDQTDQVKLAKYSDGAPFIDINAIPSDGTSNASVRFFRETNTTGTSAIEIKTGDGTNTNQHIIRGSGNTLMQLSSGALGINTSNPYNLNSVKLDVEGRAVVRTGLSVSANNANLRFGGNMLEMSGGNGSWNFNVQDGDGRVNHRWNATSGTTPAFQESGDKAAEWDLDGWGGFGLSIRESTTGGTAGGSITWDTYFQTGANGTKIFGPLNLVPQTAPSGSEGNIYYDSTDDELKVHNGTEYVSVGGGGGASQTTYSFIFMKDAESNQDEYYLPVSSSNLNPSTVGTGDRSFYNYDGTNMEFWAKATNSFGNYAGSNFEIELLEDTDDNPSGATVVHTFNIDDLDGLTNERFSGSATLSADRFYWLKIESSGMSSSDDFAYGFTITK